MSFMVRPKSGCEMVISGNLFSPQWVRLREAADPQLPANHRVSRLLRTCQSRIRVPVLRGRRIARDGVITITTEWQPVCRRPYEPLLEFATPPDARIRLQAGGVAGL